MSGETLYSRQTTLTAAALMVRPGPRFLNWHRLDLPVVLQNQTDDPLVVDVAVRAANLV